jgi:hypothetical protein
VVPARGAVVADEEPVRRCGMPMPGGAADTFRILSRRTKVAKLYLLGKTQYEIAREVRCSQGTVGNDLAALREEWLASALLDFGEAKARELARIDNLESEAWDAWYRSAEDSRTYRRRVEEAAEWGEDGDEGAGEGGAEGADDELRRPATGEASVAIGDDQGAEDGASSKAARPGSTPARPPRPPRPVPKPLRAQKGPVPPKMRPVRASTETTLKSGAGDPRFLERVAWCIDTRLKLMGAYKSGTTVNNLIVRWDELYGREGDDSSAGLPVDPIERRIAQAEREGRVLPMSPAAEWRPGGEGTAGDPGRDEEEPYEPPEFVVPGPDLSPYVPRDDLPPGPAHVKQQLNELRGPATYRGSRVASPSSADTNRARLEELEAGDGDPGGSGTGDE